MIHRERIDTGVWTKRAIARWCLCILGGTVAAASCVGVIGPQMGWHGAKHGIGGAIAELLPKGARACVSPHWVDWVVGRSPDGFVGIGEDSSGEGRGALTEAVQGGDTVWTCKLYERRFPAGAWGQTAWRQIATLEVFEWSSAPQTHAYGTLSTSELSAVRSAALRGMKAQWPLEWPQSETNLIAAGTWTGTQPFHFGWIINACTVVGITVFVWTAPGVVRDSRRHRRALALLRDHCCGWCGYDVRGLAEGMRVCPECGKDLRAAEGPAG